MALIAGDQEGCSMKKFKTLYSRRTTSPPELSVPFMWSARLMLICVSLACTQFE